MRTPKPRKCSVKSCRQPAKYHRGLLHWCSEECGTFLALQQLAKKKATDAKVERAQQKVARQRIKPRNMLVSEAQSAVNAYVRERDHDKACVSCYRFDFEIPEFFTGGKWDAGHFVAVGVNPSIRFEPLNIHKQCKWCNHRKGGGSHPGYDPEIRRRIGSDKVDWLKGPHPAQHLSREDLERIKVYFRAEKRRLKREREQRSAVA